MEDAIELFVFRNPWAQKVWMTHGSFICRYKGSVEGLAQWEVEKWEFKILLELEPRSSQT